MERSLTNQVIVTKSMTELGRKKVSLRGFLCTFSDLLKIPHGSEGCCSVSSEMTNDLETLRFGVAPLPHNLQLPLIIKLYLLT